MQVQTHLPSASHAPLVVFVVTSPAGVEAESAGGGGDADDDVCGGGGDADDDVCGGGRGGGGGDGGGDGLRSHALGGPSLDDEPSVRAYTSSHAVAPPNMSFKSPMVGIDFVLQPVMSALNAGA